MGKASLSVGDLVGTAHLGLEVLAGGNGLGRSVSWAHVAETDDPAMGLEGGEILMTSGHGFPKTGTAQVRYVERLAEGRAAALAVGGRGPELRQQMLRAADALVFPVLRVGEAVPFVSISQHVMTANQHAAHRRLLRQVQLFDTLRPRNGARLEGEELFAELQDISGYDLALLSANGRPVLPGLGWVPELDLELLADARGDHLSLPGGYALPVPVGARAAATLIGIQRSGKEPAGLSALRHIATIAGLEVAEAYRLREARRRSGAEALTELLGGQLTAEEAVCRLDAEGLAPGVDVILAAFRGVEGDLDDEELHHRLSDDAIAHLMLRQDEVYVLLADHDPGRLTSLAEELDAVVGASATIVNPAGLAVAKREALWSLARTTGSAGRRVARFGEADQYARWLPADLGALRQMVGAILGPIDAYDATNSTSLLLSLATFFRHQRRLGEAAGELHVHKHTLAYRLRRIEELTGRDLNDLQDISELWLAIKALPIVRGQAGGLGL